MTEVFCVVFDGPPNHDSGRFVEVETANGNSIKYGQWEQSIDGYWRLWFGMDHYFVHKKNDDDTDTCAECGRDIRHHMTDEAMDEYRKTRRKIYEDMKS